jgi:hypothetical protein
MLDELGQLYNFGYIAMTVKAIDGMCLHPWERSLDSTELGEYLKRLSPFT